MSVELIDRPAVQVSTVHVEIKALMVGKKQFTIAMLKQLESELLEVMYDRELRALRLLGNYTIPKNIWGFVIYPLSEDAKVHVIFDENGRLYRLSAPSKRAFTLMGIKWTEIDQLFIAV